MEIGGFFFDFPVWVAGCEQEGRQALSFCEVEGQWCILVFTDEDLLAQYFQNHEEMFAETIPISMEVDSADELASLIEGALLSPAH